ncbi:MAG: ABC transporter ATP-binding protein [Candidatus Lernaella stagnicola]|nr:ABC transporter ATP-binding protein [Candidatus Lernaella stagnicola]
MSEVLIELEGVSKIFRSRGRIVRAMDAISFRVRAGDVFGLLGPNGAGKSTTLRAILMLTRLDAGRLRVFGRERPDRRTLFGQAAYLPEEPQLFQGATGSEHLRYFGRLCGMKNPDLSSRIGQVLEMVGLSDAGDRPIATYSKGMKQRIGIAAAILDRPRIIFLDEPTRGLDPIGGRQVRDVLKRLADEGVTLFLNSHMLGEVERLCNRVVILERGRVRADGLLSDLLTVDETMEVRFTLPPGSDAATFGDAMVTEGALYKLTVADTAALGELAGRVAAAGGRIVSTRATRVELEDFFLQVVREAESS